LTPATALPIRAGPEGAENSTPRPPEDVGKGPKAGVENAQGLAQGRVSAEVSGSRARGVSPAGSKCLAWAECGGSSSDRLGRKSGRLRQG